MNATPSARRHARKNGIDLNEVAGKGSDVIRKDVDNSQNQVNLIKILNLIHNKKHLKINC